MLAEIVNTFVLQSDAVEHAAGCLCHAWVVVAFTRIECGAFDDDAAYVFEIDEVGKFDAVAKCA